MKNILTICLICFALSETVTEDEKGPAYNLKHAQSDKLCHDNSTGIPTGVSDCVDSLLWVSELDRYADRCCYMRYQKNGEMFARCIALTEVQYMDISETIQRFEKGESLTKKYFSKKNKDSVAGDLETEFENSKIYQLDCASSYLKVLSIASALFALLL